MFTEQMVHFGAALKVACGGNPPEKDNSPVVKNLDPIS